MAHRPKEYRRIVGRDSWHFNRKCQHWPTGSSKLGEYVARTTKPTSGEMCDECKAKERKVWKDAVTSVLLVIVILTLLGVPA